MCHTEFRYILASLPHRLLTNYTTPQNRKRSGRNGMGYSYPICLMAGYCPGDEATLNKRTGQSFI